MQATPVIKVKNCAKTFMVHRKEPGLLGSVRSLFHRAWEEKHALVDVSLEVSAGEIVGLVGANGAGKTTLVKILSGIIHPTHGEVSVLGHNPWRRENGFRSRIALLMGQKAQLWWDLPAADCFLLLREIYRVPPEEFTRRVDFLADTLGVADLMTTQIRRLSLGERMKMELMASLLHQPGVVYLDEPTIGLDLTSQRAIREFLLAYREEHQPAMILTSHYMEDIRYLCRRIVIIKKGSIVYDGPLAHVVKEHNLNKVVAVVLAAGTDTQAVAAQAGTALDTEIEVTAGELRVRTARRDAPDAAQYLLQHFDIVDLTIEDDDISSIIESIQAEDSSP